MIGGYCGLDAVCGRELDPNGIGDAGDVGVNSEIAVVATDHRLRAGDTSFAANPLADDDAAAAAAAPPPATPDESVLPTCPRGRLSRFLSALIVVAEFTSLLADEWSILIVALLPETRLLSDEASASAC